MENVFGVVGNIGRHTSELDGKGIEVDGVVVRKGQTLQQLTDSDAREKTALRSRLPLTQFQDRRKNIGILLFAHMQALAPLFLVGEQLYPVLRPDY